MRYLLSWFLYGIGCAVSAAMSWFDNISYWMYPIYNKIMLLSGDVQGQGSGPWTIIEEDEDGAG